MLKTLVISHCNINNELTGVTASALTEKSSLKQLHMEDNGAITLAGWIKFLNGIVIPAAHLDTPHEMPS